MTHIFLEKCRSLVLLLAIFILSSIVAVHAQDVSAPVIVPDAEPILPLGQPPVVTQEANIISPESASPGTTVPDAGTTVTAQPQPAVVNAELNPNDIRSLFFTYWEYTAIKDAKYSRGLVRPPTEEELMRSLNTGREELHKPPPEEREVTLAGIVYVDHADWTIWLNGKRVTPTAIPPEVFDLKVSKEYIEMKWFDEYTNQVFPLRLRPHQRFNIDTRIFLPG